VLGKGQFVGKCVTVQLLDCLTARTVSLERQKEEQETSSGRMRRDYLYDGGHSHDLPVT